MAVKSGEERLKEMEAEMALWVQPLRNPHQIPKNHIQGKMDFFVGARKIKWHISYVNSSSFIMLVNN